jgi:ATP-dependent DNA helicase PIF1
MMDKPVLTEDQAKSLELMKSGENIFLTGGAGSGKSFVIREFLRTPDSQSMPLLASTGTAAVLIGGRTFHSFFGLGIMEGGAEKTVERATQNRRVCRRISEAEGIIIDEVSMISASAFAAAETISRIARESQLPWGGLRVIAVGDFAQLPPVSRGQTRDWAFKSERWMATDFLSYHLQGNQRTKDELYLRILSKVRFGGPDEEVRDFLNDCIRIEDPEDKATRLYPLREQVENHNSRELDSLIGDKVAYPTIFLGDERFRENFKNHLPIPETLSLKKDAVVMFVQNDPQKRWVNGTLGRVVDLQTDKLVIRKQRGREVTVDKAQFSLQDADGNVLMSAINFPLKLGYATTIHKSQGATLEQMWVDMSRLWEPGQAYVALSRLTTAEGLRLLGWHPRSFLVDPEVNRFYQNLKS